MLLQALLMCFHDESWPVRDEACLACGIFCKAYPITEEDGVLIVKPVRREAVLGFVKVSQTRSISIIRTIIKIIGAREIIFQTRRESILFEPT
jgi:hypothetical protein